MGFYKDLKAIEKQEYEAATSSSAVRDAAVVSAMQASLDTYNVCTYEVERRGRLGPADVGLRAESPRARIPAQPPQRREEDESDSSSDGETCVGAHECD